LPLARLKILENKLEFTDREITVIFNNEMKAVSSYDHHFDWETYRSNLTSQKYGKLVIYGDVLPTTMDVFEG